MYYGRHFRSPDGEIPPLMCGILDAVGDGVDAHAAGRQRHLGSRHHHEREGRGAARPEGRRHVDAHVAVVPARRALGRRRADRRRASRSWPRSRTGTARSSSTARPSPPVCSRSPIRGRAPTRRSVGARRSGSCTRSRCATCCASRRSTSRWSSRSAGTRSPTRPSSPTTGRRSTSTGTGSPRSTRASTARTYDPGDPRLRDQPGAARRRPARIPTLFRAFLRIAGVLASPGRGVRGSPGVAEKVIELGAGWRDEPVFAPTREELLAIVAG